MNERAAGAGSFGEVWPLLALRYALITIAVLAWLWEAEAVTGIIVGAVLFSLVLLLELLLHSQSSARHPGLWGAIQVVAGIGAFMASPGLPAALILAAIMCGVAATASRG